MSDKQKARGPQENAALTALENVNRRTLARIEQFRADYAEGRATGEHFSKLKHEFPFYGFVPCRSGDTDFVLFQANDDVVAWEYCWFGADHYEKRILATWQKWCRDADLVYDIGAYTGLMSILAALVQPKATVHLFEPIDRTVERAKINVRANRVGKRVKLHNVAASDEATTASINLYRDEDFLGTGNSIYDKGKQVIGAKMIQCVRVDDYLKGLSPQVVKVDVEGHELACLNGMRETIERARPRMIVEVWEHTRSEVLALLQGMGYTCTPYEKAEIRVMNFRCEPSR
ncbi:MAG: FkbM family methyltransferase [Hyphomonadaceae bacterium]|nr:FkbM family methyltransferase [Hyphomonadaceae bacterium]